RARLPAPARQRRHPSACSQKGSPSLPPSLPANWGRGFWECLQSFLAGPYLDSSKPPCLVRAESDGVPEFVVRTRKRKADVVIAIEFVFVLRKIGKSTKFLQDPDEDTSSINTTSRKSNESQSNYAACPYSHLLIPTPEKDEELENANFANSKHQKLVSARETPLPVLGWANRDEVWQNMLSKEQKYARDKLYMEKHPLLEPKMRVILLDWLMEEIYPPKLHQFAYVTDGYQLSDIEKCVKWMVPFAMAIKENKAQTKQAMLAEKNMCSPLPTGVLTPPQSSKKLPRTSK
ncbi:hypothetical protein Chor_013399, partial [Crotalus horridus]